jgi:hypothetical protein
MRTLRAVAVVLALLGAACGGDDKSPSVPTPTPPVIACSYAIAPATLALAATGSLAKATLAVSTTGTCSWTAAVDIGWLTVTPSTGSGSQSLAVVASDNVETGTRTATIRVAGQSVAVTQAGSVR